MAETANNSTTRRYAVVTGANKGIGLEICRQLASDHGITVILTARDEQRGLEAVEKLKKTAFLSSDDSVIFHQLDVTDSSSVASLAEFINTNFGRLDILVNNAGMVGAIIDANAFSSEITKNGGATGFKWDGLATETFELAEICLQTNYYGAKRTIEALISLLQSSNSPRIVNVSSNMGKLKNLPNKWAKRILNDEQNLTKERVDEVLNEYLKDFKEGSRLAKGWPRCMSANIISKASMNAYTRILAKQYPNFRINAVCPGFVKTDINFNTGILTVKEGAESAVKLVLVPNDGPSGLFFIRNELASFE